jgi:hypothetical protein
MNAMPWPAVRERDSKNAWHGIEVDVLCHDSRTLLFDKLQSRIEDDGF